MGCGPAQGWGPGAGGLAELEGGICVGKGTSLFLNALVLPGE